MMNPKELIDCLTTDREWAQANEWESPICLQDDLSAAIAVVANYSQITDWLRRNGFESFEALVEAFSQVKRERDAYMFCNKDLLSRGNCNECGDRENCDYLPRPGETVRANCPLWCAPQKEE